MKSTSKIRVLQLSDWSFKSIETFISNGGDASDLARYGYEYIKKSDIDVDLYTPDDSKLSTKLLTKFLHLEGRSLILQIESIKKSKNYDVIYYPADRHLICLALARKFRICKAPVLMICHFSFNPRTVQSKLKKLLLKIERRLVFSGMDRILFACDNIMKLAAEDGNLPDKHMNNSQWGADISYFNRGIKDLHADIKPFYLAAGGANRDYKTLIDAFRKIPHRIVIFCNKTIAEKAGEVPENIIFHDIADDGIGYYQILRSYYIDAKAVLLPIDKSNHVPNGATVLAEGLAARKPIIISDLPTNFVDVEKEDIGLKVKLHDINDWIRAIEYLENHPEHVNQMGENSYKLAKECYNYELFSKNVIKNLKEVVE